MKKMMGIGPLMSALSHTFVFGYRSWTRTQIQLPFLPFIIHRKFWIRNDYRY